MPLPPWAPAPWARAACNVSLGTSGTVFISSDHFRLPPEGNLHAFAHADGAYHLMGCILSAASAYGWWTKEILKAQSDDDEQNPVTDEALGRNPVFFVPYLMGERSPPQRSRRPGRVPGHDHGTPPAIS